MAHSDEKWETAKALFFLGRTVREIAKETKISFGYIAEKSRRENWSIRKSHIQDGKSHIVRKTAQLLENCSTNLEKELLLNDLHQQINFVSEINKVVNRHLIVNKKILNNLDKSLDETPMDLAKAAMTNSAAMQVTEKLAKLVGIETIENKEENQNVDLESKVTINILPIDATN